MNQQQQGYFSAFSRVDSGGVSDQSNTSGENYQLPAFNNANIMQMDHMQQHNTAPMQLTGSVSNQAMSWSNTARPIEGHTITLLPAAGGQTVAQWNGSVWVATTQHQQQIVTTIPTQGNFTSQTISSPYYNQQPAVTWGNQTQATGQLQTSHAITSQQVTEQPTIVTMPSSSDESLIGAQSISNNREDAARDSLLTLSSQALQESLAHDVHHVHHMLDETEQQDGNIIKPEKVFDGSYAVCGNCGTLSKNYSKCDSCRKVLPANVKLYNPETVKAERERLKREAKEKVDQEKLLLVKLKEEQEQRIESVAMSLRDASKKKGNAKGLNPYIVCTTVNAATKVQSALEALDCKNKILRVVLTDCMLTTERTSRSFYGRKVVTRNYKEIQDNCPRNGGGRKVAKKEAAATVVHVLSSDDENADEESASTSIPRKFPIVKLQRTTLSTLPTLSTLKPDVDHIEGLYMKCNRITVGTLQGDPKEPLHIALSGVDLSLDTEESSVKVRLDNRDVIECLGCTHKRLPVLFIRANASFGKKVRSALQMTEPNKDPYYDPASTDIKYRYIVVYMDIACQISNLDERLNEVFRAISLKYQTGSVLYRCIPWNVAQCLLAGITGEAAAGKVTSTNSVLADLSMNYADPPEVEQEEEEKPMFIFQGPIVRMFTYPLPPAVGGLPVTNEDYFCLNEGEFLNDVVISFYLKYLYEEILSLEDRNRTFIFSSFFYTRLTQKMADSVQAKNSPENRHSRVKTWTKNVDIFSKDFIIIPINENSHWYLAIICYPWLDKIVYRQVETVETKLSGDDVVSSTTQENENSVKNVSGDTGNEMNLTIASVAGNVPMDVSQLEDSSQALNNGSPSTSSKGINSSLVNKSGLQCNDPFGFDDSEDEEDAEDVKSSAGPATSIEKRPCILLFDSLAGPGHAKVIRALRDYLTVEWRTRKGSERSFGREVLSGANPKCPQQENYSDCGVFLLQYVQSFFQTPIQDYSIPMTCTRNWFDTSIIKTKRAEIMKLMDSYKEAYARLTSSKTQKS